MGYWLIKNNMMNFKSIITSILISLISLTLSAQKVKLKGNNIIINGKVTLKYEKESMASEFYVYSIDSNNLIVSIQRMDDYAKIYFPKSKQIIETESLSGNSYKKFIELFIKRKVIDVNGKVNEAKILDFVNQYHENISNRTILVK